MRTSMVQLFILLFAVTVLAFVSNRQRRPVEAMSPSCAKGSITKRTPLNFDVICFIIIVVLSLYCGLRTSYNDTSTYIRNFKDLSLDFTDIDWSISQNFGFRLYQMFIKKFISDNPQWLLIITSTVVVSIQTCFYKRYSVNFCCAMFLYITSGVYIFAFGALKQTLATAIIMWSFRFVEERKWGKFYLVMAIALTIHAYVFVLAVIPFFVNSVWDKKTYMVLIGAVLIGMFFGSFIEVLASFLGEIDEYYTADVLEGEGVNIFRVLVFAVPVIFSWICRKQINEEKNMVLTLCTNLTILSFVAMFISLFGNPILFGRIGNYFQPFFIVTMCYCLFKGVSPKKRTVILICMAVGYIAFFYMIFDVYACIDNFFGHTSFFSLFE